MQIALYQCPPLPLDKPANLRRLQQQAALASAAGAGLLVCPEMFLTGYNIGAAAVTELAEAADGPSMQQAAAIAREHGIALLYGYPERGADGRVYNSAQLLDRDGQARLNYRKTHLFGELDRGLFSAGGDDFPVVELDGWKLGVLICYDLEFPENCRRLALTGAQAIIVPTANMLPFGFVAEVTVRSRAFENHCYVAYANYCGQEDGIEYCGLSSVAGPLGDLPGLAGDAEQLLIATLDSRALGMARRFNDYLLDRRQELY
ncbi:carbon-nitrogen hydrolase family protein [Pseudomonas sp. HR96]|uniref:carbon-nitrogen hydrolase family protein n=1 Tax=Pseudomonas sp. HR96 TaxID=1027966 RepID=UPI002A7596BE|nr:carbon-nitrogen hydrolase family protein [Pseudomonas sp. HR96]WPP00345.1 carbon-nitrogen hydrolase family protein [Pseudomonas sp. HR96]